MGSEMCIRDSYKIFFSVAVHNFDGDVEVLQSFAHYEDAVDYRRKWNDGMIGEKL